MQIEREIVEECRIKSNDRCKLLVQIHRSDIVRRRGYRIWDITASDSVLSETEAITNSYPVAIGVIRTDLVGALVIVLEVEGLEHAFEEWDTHQAIVGNTPVGKDGLQTWERIQIHFLGILARIGGHKGRDQHVAAERIDSSIFYIVGAAGQLRSPQETTIGIGFTHVLLLQPLGNDRYVAQELLKYLALVIVIHVNTLESSCESHVGLDVATAVENRRISKHELNLTVSFIGTVAFKRDLEARYWLKNNLGIEFLGVRVDGRSCLALITHQPVTTHGFFNIGLTCKTKGKVQTR